MIPGFDCFTYFMSLCNNSCVPKQRKARNINKYISLKPDNDSTEKANRFSPIILKIEGKKRALYKMPRN